MNQEFSWSRDDASGQDWPSSDQDVTRQRMPTGASSSDCCLQEAPRRKAIRLRVGEASEARGTPVARVSFCPLLSLHGSLRRR